MQASASTAFGADTELRKRAAAVSFLPPASFDPDDKEVASYVGLIRETVKKKTPTGVLRTLTSFMHAITLFCLHQFGHIETSGAIKAGQDPRRRNRAKTTQRGKSLAGPF
jgi:hypothetical protein